MSMIIDGSLGATFPDASVQAVKAGPTGGGTDRVFQQNNLVVSTAYTIPSTVGALCVGPITFNAAVTVNGRLVIQ
jgi:hypothetical protein